MGTLYIDHENHVDAVTGQRTRVAPGRKSIAGMTAVLDHTFSVAAGDTDRLWDSTTFANQTPNWEAAIVEVVTSGATVSLEITGDGVLLCLAMRPEIPFYLPTRDAEATTDTTPSGKVTDLKVHNYGASAALVRVVLFGPEA